MNELMQELDSDWTLVKGATSGFGYEMAKMLASRGENLILVSGCEESLCHLARELNEISDIIIMPVDLTIPGFDQMIHDECMRLGLKVVAVINNEEENGFQHSP